jgi:hypothetical protein
MLLWFGQWCCGLDNVVVVWAMLLWFAALTPHRTTIEIQGEKGAEEPPLRQRTAATVTAPPTTAVFMANYVGV